MKFKQEILSGLGTQKWPVMWSHKLADSAECNFKKEKSEKEMACVCLQKYAKNACVFVKVCKKKKSMQTWSMDVHSANK